VAYLKRGLQDRLNKLTWMEEKSKRIAIEKVKQMVDKAGYPSWMTDNDFIDQQYPCVFVWSHRVFPIPRLKSYGVKSKGIPFKAVHDVNKHLPSPS